MAAEKRDMTLQPRVIRLKHAARYLGMDKNRFDAEVRPYVTAVRIGVRGIGFDRLDLDAWFDEYKARFGRPGSAMKGGLQCQRPRGRSGASSRGAVSGGSKRDSIQQEYEKALELVRARYRSNTSSAISKKSGGQDRKERG